MRVLITGSMGYRPADPGGAFLALNVGVDSSNYQVKDLAQVVADAVSGTTVSISRAAQPDGRSYKVDFGLFRKLAPGPQPAETLESSIAALDGGLRAICFADADFRRSPFIRLRVLECHIEESRLDEELSWCVHPTHGVAS